MSRPSFIHVYINDAQGEDDLVDLAHSLEWLPMMGPSATVLAQLLIRRDLDDITQHSIVDLAVRLGVRPRQVWHAIDRLIYFRVAAMPSTDTLVLLRYLSRLGDTHRRMIDERTALWTEAAQ